MDSKEKEVIRGTTTAIKGLSITLYRQAFFLCCSPAMVIHHGRAQDKKTGPSKPAGFLCTKRREDVQIKLLLLRSCFYLLLGSAFLQQPLVQPAGHAPDTIAAVETTKITANNATITRFIVELL